MEPFSSLVEILEHRAATQSDERALIFLSDRGRRRSRSSPSASCTMPRTRSPSGLPPRHSPATARCWFFLRDLEFVVAFFGCLIARIIAVPMMVPRRQSARDSSASIMANCKPTLALTSPALACARRSRRPLRRPRAAMDHGRHDAGRDGRDRSAASASRRHRIPAVHLRLDLRPEGRRGHARECCSPICGWRSNISAPASIRPASTGCRSITTWG